MQKRIVITIIVCLSIGIFSCTENNTTKAVQPAIQTNKDSLAQETIKIDTALLANRTDPYCEMKIMPNEIADTAIYKGKIFGFCSKECKTFFSQNPKNYLAKANLKN